MSMVWVQTSPSGWNSGGWATPRRRTASGQDLGEEAEIEEQLEAAARASLGEDAGELVADALGADLGDLGGVAADGGGGGGVDLEVEARGEADGAQHAQLVLGEAQAGVADGADDAGGEVFAAMDEVERGGGGVAGGFEGEGVEEHAVDGEVAAEDVFARDRWSNALHRDGGHRSRRRRCGRWRPR